ncbi:hypothetical protein [Sandarakinorhabdus sp.]|jgi:hypothetical protein|uniref:hypothetical protein n=1 Tax=Sandarakinorhabdus sp. TaxID=1916663 RepID=UPI00333E5EB6
MKVIPTEFEPQVRVVTTGEAQAIDRPLQSMIKRRRRVMLNGFTTAVPLFHAA